MPQSTNHGFSTFSSIKQVVMNSEQFSQINFGKIQPGWWHINVQRTMRTRGWYHKKLNSWLSFNSKAIVQEEICNNNHQQTIMNQSFNSSYYFEFSHSSSSIINGPFSVCRVKVINDGHNLRNTATNYPPMCHTVLYNDHYIHLDDCS